MVGAGLLAFPVLALGAGACRGSEEEVRDPELEEAAALGLPAGARLHRVTLGGRGSIEHAVPTRIEATSGDGVEFRTVDHRVHTVTFPPDSLTTEVRAFLESSGQMESLPLVSRGTRFLLLLRDAPAGRYPFVSEGHGGTAHGVVEVRPTRGWRSVGAS